MGPLYINAVIGRLTLAVGGWAVTFGTARRGLGGLRPRPVPSSAIVVASCHINVLNQGVYNFWNSNLKSLL